MNNSGLIMPEYLTTKKKQTQLKRFESRIKHAARALASVNHQGH